MYKVPVMKKFSSPAKIENAIRGYFTGMGDLALKGSDAFLDWIDVGDIKVPPAYKLSDIPLLDALSTRWPAPRTRPMEEFYDIYNKLQKKRDSHFEVIGLRGNLDKLDPVIGIDGEHWTWAESATLKKMDQTHKQLDILRQVAGGIWEDDSLSSDEKRSLLDATYWFMNNVARVGNGQAQAEMTQWQSPQQMRKIFRRAIDEKLGVNIELDFNAYE